MLIRFVLNNFFSFGEQREFSMIANKRLKTLDHHKYNFDNLEILKLASIYGANGAGKSNLVKALKLLKTIVVEGEIPYSQRKTYFKLGATKQIKQSLAIEFVQSGIPFYYAVELEGLRIAREELYTSGLGNDNDELIFDRRTDSENVTSIKFSKEFEQDESCILFKDILLDDFVKPTKTILRLISNRKNNFLSEVKKSYEWFDKTLQIITPLSKPSPLAHRIEKDKEFKEYAEELMKSFGAGINSISTESKKIDDYFGQDKIKALNDVIKDLYENPSNMACLRDNSGGNELLLVNQGGEIWVKSISLEHRGEEGGVSFELSDESDGTIRLMDFVPAFKSVISEKQVFVIDEIERSIHPLLIKELIRKYSDDRLTKGQLIFTTHESNLLDQEIFRQDEIWFTEKNTLGATDLYSLADFKEHKTKDIRKGYLHGRYGSIPFLGNLEDLKWHQDDS